MRPVSCYLSIFLPWQLIDNISSTGEKRISSESLWYSYTLIRDAAPEPGQAVYVGCFSPQDVQALKEEHVLQLKPGAHNDVINCVDQCWERRKKFAFLKDGVYCLCSDVVHGLIKTDKRHCATPCAGNGAHLCGGLERLSVYYTGYVQEPFFTQITAAGVQQASRGCHKEDAGVGICAVSVTSSRMQVAMCLSLCEDSLLPYAALDSPQRCCCTASLKTAVKIKDSVCDARCSDGYQCGGPSGYLTVYATDTSTHLKNYKMEVADYFWMRPHIDEKSIQKT